MVGQNKNTGTNQLDCTGVAQLTQEIARLWAEDSANRVALGHLFIALQEACDKGGIGYMKLLMELGIPYTTARDYQRAAKGLPAYPRYSPVTGNRNSPALTWEGAEEPENSAPSGEDAAPLRLQLDETFGSVSVPVLMLEKDKAMFLENMKAIGGEDLSKEIIDLVNQHPKVMAPKVTGYLENTLK